MKDLAPRSPAVMAVAVGATTPAPPAGEFPVIYSTTAAAYLRWNGTAWRPLVNITVGTTAPTSPAVGDLWVDTN